MHECPNYTSDPLVKKLTMTSKGLNSSGSDRVLTFLAKPFDLLARSREGGT